MSRNLKQGLVFFFISSIFMGIIAQLSELTMYLCIISNISYTTHWYDYINEISLFMVIISYIISFSFIKGALKEIKKKKSIL